MSFVSRYFWVIMRKKNLWRDLGYSWNMKCSHSSHCLYTGRRKIKQERRRRARSDKQRGSELREITMNHLLDSSSSKRTPQGYTNNEYYYRLFVEISQEPDNPSKKYRSWLFPIIDERGFSLLIVLRLIINIVDKSISSKYACLKKTS